MSHGTKTQTKIVGCRPKVLPNRCEDRVSIELLPPSFVVLILRFVVVISERDMFVCNFATAAALLFNSIASFLSHNSKKCGEC
jgi:hypothetical protein